MEATRHGADSGETSASGRIATTAEAGADDVTEPSGTGAERAPQHFSMQGSEAGAGLAFEQQEWAEEECAHAIEASAQWFEATSQEAARTATTMSLLHDFVLDIRSV